MKCIYFLLLVAVSQSHVKAELQAPRITKLIALDGPAFEIEWNTIKNDDEKTPVVGYKVKVWELSEIKVYKYKVVDGVKKLVEEMQPPKTNDNSVPKGDAKEIVVPGSDTNKLVVKDNVKYNVLYDIRVLAYTKNEDGPLSLPAKIKIIQDDKSEHDKDVYVIT